MSYAFDPAPVFVSQASQQATDGWDWPDLLASIESVRGSSHADVLVGDERSTTFAGGPGDDRIAGRAGADLIEGEAGRDHLSGGRDTDLVSFRTESRRVKVYLGLGYALAGRKRDDLVAIEGALGSRYDDVLVGDAGPNRFMGLNGTDWIDGGGGVDVVAYDSLVDPADGELVDAGPATVYSALVGDGPRETRATATRSPTWRASRDPAPMIG